MTRIVDAQIHLWGSGLPSNMAHRQVGLLSTLVLAWFAWTGGQTIWPLVALSFIQGASRTSSTPVEQAMLGSLVPERDLLITRTCRHTGGPSVCSDGCSWSC